jgi:hypothetical protein
MLTLPGARVGDEEPFSQRDIAAFRTESSSLFRAKLADRPPAVGEPIWLVVRRGQGTTERTIEAVVVELTDRTLVFRFMASEPLPSYTSGAPLVNFIGEVVGINIGSGFVDGYRFGHGNHVASIRRHLDLTKTP